MLVYQWTVDEDEDGVSLTCMMVFARQTTAELEAGV